jgi:IS605 OrfB family transposase
MPPIGFPPLPSPHSVTMIGHYAVAHPATLVPAVYSLTAYVFPLNQVSAGPVRRFDLIAVEKLNVKGLAASKLAKSVHDASRGRRVQMIRYKAGRAGGRIVEVDPRNTSQACFICGVIAPKTLRERTRECPDCGFVLDRDHNAALNVWRPAVGDRCALKVADCCEPATGKLSSISN